MPDLGCKETGKREVRDSGQKQNEEAGRISSFLGEMSPSRTTAEAPDEAGEKVKAPKRAPASVVV